MLRSRLSQSLAACAYGPCLSPPDDDGGGGGSTATGDKAASDDAKPGGEQGAESGFKPITSEAELAKYKDDLRKNIAADLRKSIKEDLDAARVKDEDEARKKKDLDEAAARGAFEDVKKQLESDLSTATTEKDRLAAENATLRTALQAGLTESWDALPEEVRKIGARQHGDDDIIGRFTFLHDADTQTLVKKLTQSGDANGSGRDPKPGGDTAVSDKDRREAQAPIYRRF